MIKSHPFLEKLRSGMIRGGRMTKLAGVAASYAPQFAGTLVVAGPLMMSVLSAALADCVANPAGSGTFECSGSATVTQDLSPPAGQALDVSTTDQVSIVTTTGNALRLNSYAGITFTDD